MNCLHKVVVFHPVKPEEPDEVLESELDIVQKRMLGSTMRPFLFRISEQGRKFLLQEGTDQGHEGRHLKRAIERHVVRPIARLLATAQVHQGEVLFIDHYPGEQRLLFRRDTKNRFSVWTHKYAHDEAVSERNVSAVAAAIDRNVHQGLDEIVESLEQYFSSVKTRATP